MPVVPMEAATVIVKVERSGGFQEKREKAELLDSGSRRDQEAKLLRRARREKLRLRQPHDSRRLCHSGEKADTRHARGQVRLCPSKILPTKSRFADTRTEGCSLGQSKTAPKRVAGASGWPELLFMDKGAPGEEQGPSEGALVRFQTR